MLRRAEWGSFKDVLEGCAAITTSKCHGRGDSRRPQRWEPSTRLSGTPKRLPWRNGRSGLLARTGQSHIDKLSLCLEHELG